MKYEMLCAEPITGTPPAQLDLVVPFTTPELTRAAIRAADAFGSDLHAAIRLVRLQAVPFHTDISPVNPEFIEAQLSSMEANLPMRRFAVFTRDCENDLLATLKPDSVVILAARPRFWKTKTERLAAMLLRHGHWVVLVSPSRKQEAQHA
jgi:hypothetical protein